MSENRKSVWDNFYMETGYFTHVPFDSSRKYDMSNYPGQYKSYEKPIKKIPVLKEDFSKISTPIGKTIEERRSKRNFTTEILTFRELSFMLWATQGITGQIGSYSLRATPSAGALYPVETYICVQNMKELEKGLYHLNVKNQELEFLKQGDLTIDVWKASHEQELVKLAAVTFLWTAVLERSTSKYYERGYRYVLFDTAHIAENLSLACAALDNVGCTIVGAFFDDLATNVCVLDFRVEPVLLMAGVGKVAGVSYEEDRRSYMEKLRRNS